MQKSSARSICSSLFSVNGRVASVKRTIPIRGRKKTGMTVIELPIILYIGRLPIDIHLKPW